MASLNRVTVLGRLGKDPELRHTQNSKAVATFSVATSEKSGGQEKTTWHTVVVWEKQAENCAKYLAKGREVLVEGRIDVRQWEDKQGQKRHTTEIVAHNVQFIGGAPKAEQREETERGVRIGHADHRV